MRTGSKTKGLRNASAPFALPLTHYKLAFPTLEEQTGMKAKDTGSWLQSEGKIISCSEGTLRLSLSLNREKVTLTLTVAESGLTIACSCGSAVASLCHHAYTYLYRASRYNIGNGFEDYIAGGRLETALRLPFLFTYTFTGGSHLYVKPKKELGGIYGWEENGFLGGFFAMANRLPEAAISKEGERKEKAVVYLLMSSPRAQYAPFLVPCPGRWNKEGTDIKTFGNYFLNASVHEDKHLLGGEEAPRLQACADIGKKSEGVPGWANYNDKEAGFDILRLAELHMAWAHSIPLFREAPVFPYSYFGSRTFRHKPVRRYTRPVRLRNDRLTLSFILHQKEHHYNLRLAVEVAGKPLKEYSLVASFFLQDKEGGNLYFLPSLRDAGLVYWMQKNGGLVTVLAPHFPSFEQHILAPLREHYPVKIAPPKPAKKQSRSKKQPPES